MSIAFMENDPADHFSKSKVSKSPLILLSTRLHFLVESERARPRAGERSVHRIAPLTSCTFFARPKGLARNVIFALKMKKGLVFLST